MSDDDEEKIAYLVCGRVADMHGDSIATGSIQMICGTCRELIWVSPASMDAVAQYTERRYLCIPCAIPKIKPDSKFVMTAKQQMEFLRYVSQNQSYGEFD